MRALIMGLYKHIAIAAVAAVALLIVIDRAGSNEVTDEKYRLVSGVLGCAAGCKFMPQNIAQLLLCIVTNRAGTKTKMENLFQCGEHADSTACAGKTSADKEKCFWYNNPKELSLGASPGACLPQFLETIAEFINLGAAGLGPVAKEQPAADQDLAIPMHHHIVQCLKRTKKECTTGAPVEGVQCAWVVIDEANRVRYPMEPKIEGLCIQGKLAAKATDYINFKSGEPEVCLKIPKICKCDDLDKCQGDLKTCQDDLKAKKGGSKSSMTLTGSVLSLLVSLTLVS